MIAALLLSLAAGPAVAAVGTSGRILSPAHGSCVHPGELVTVRWTPLASDVREFELLLMLDGAGNRPVRLTVQLDPSRCSYQWKVPSLPTSSARIQIRFSRGAGEELGSTSGSFRIQSSGATLLASLALRGGEWWVVSLGGSALGPMSRPCEKLTAGSAAAWPLEPMAPQSERDHLATITFGSARYRADRPCRSHSSHGERSLARAPASIPQRE